MNTEPLLDDQQLFIQVFEQAPIGMAIISPEGRVQKINNSLCCMLGYSQDELIGRHFQTSTHPEDLELNLDLLQRALNGEISSYEMTKRFFHKSGRIVWVLLSTSLIRDDKGNPSFLISQLVDITQQKTNEEKLKEIQELHQLIAEHSQDIIVRLMPDGTVTYVSPAIYTQLGYQPEEVIGMRAYDHWHPEDKDNWLEQNDQESRKIIYRIQHKNGHYVWQESSSKKIRNDEGHIQYVIAVCRDVTERKQNEDLILKSEKLSMVGELAAGIAHEIRNPLASLRGFVQYFKSGNIADTNHYYNIMLSEIDRINEIVSEMLVLAKPSKETFTLRNILDQLNDVVNLLEGEANLRNVVIRKSFEHDLPLIQGQSNLKQVFINLLKNSVESMPNGGEIFIQAKRINDKVRIRVLDQGSGIPEEQLSKIGQPFYTTKDTGTGLGIMVSQRIIQNHRGTMRIESEVGRGTDVEILLPVS